MRLVLLLCFALGAAGIARAAPFRFINANQQGVGFHNQSTNIHNAPGNPGKTLGAQRKYAFQFAARLLTSKIRSDVPIVIQASFQSLPCGSHSATLGKGGYLTAITFPNPPPGAKAGVFYPIPLANALKEHDMDSGPDIRLVFNASIDNNPACLGSTKYGSTNFYYGLDGNPPDGTVDFLAVATHELVHGLGFETITNLKTGAFPRSPTDGVPVPDIFATKILDTRQQRTWPEMDSQQRAESATDQGHVVWIGRNTTRYGASGIRSGSTDGDIHLYAPKVLSPGSSISHWSSSVRPDQLMQPVLGAPRKVDQGVGLTSCALEDMGYQLSQGVACPDRTRLTASSQVLRFGQYQKGKPVVLSAQVKNSSSSAVTVGNVAHADALQQPFSIAADTCSGAMLASGQQCTVQVTFAPSQSGDFHDSFDVPMAEPSGLSSLRVFVAGESPPTAHPQGAGAGSGGCVMTHSKVPFGPMFPFLVGLAVLFLWFRRRGHKPGS